MLPSPKLLQEDRCKFEFYRKRLVQFSQVPRVSSILSNYREYELVPLAGNRFPSHKIPAPASCAKLCQNYINSKYKQHTLNQLAALHTIVEHCL